VVGTSSVMCSPKWCSPNPRIGSFPPPQGEVPTKEAERGRAEGPRRGSGAKLPRSQSLRSGRFDPSRQRPGGRCHPPLSLDSRFLAKGRTTGISIPPSRPLPPPQGEVARAQRGTEGVRALPSTTIRLRRSQRGPNASGDLTDRPLAAMRCNFAGNHLTPSVGSFVAHTSPSGGGRVACNVATAFTQFVKRCSRRYRRHDKASQPHTPRESADLG